MSTEKPVELTDDERVAVFDALAKINNPAGATALLYAVERIKAAARREALLEAADWIAEAHPNVRGLLCAAMDIRGFAEVDVVDMADTIARVEALAERYEAESKRHRNAETITIDDGARAMRAARRATEIARDIRAALAEPERDEESGR